MDLNPAATPTMYFVGVSTGKSSIQRVFVEWARILGRPDVRLQGIDLPLHADPEQYREVTQFIKEDPLSLGALVTAHKVDLFRACSDMFDDIDPYAALLHEVSSLSKTSQGFRGAAKDPITSGLSLAAFVPDSHWDANPADIICLGAGGSSLALACYVARRYDDTSGPARLVISNRSAGRLTEFESVFAALGETLPIEYVHAPSPEINDDLVSRAPRGSLIVNATGLGKDAPGSPITDRAQFPAGGFAWDFNYRGDLIFLDQARAQQSARELVVEDGWIYFLHGWTQVISEVLHLDIPAQGSLFDELASAAANVRVARSEILEQGTHFDELASAAANVKVAR
jgi:shikimate 5-dehydrogenase